MAFMITSLLLLSIGYKAFAAASPLLFEDDIVMDKQLAKTLLPQNAYDGVLSTRQHWPKGVVPYTFASNFDSYRQQVVRQAIAEFNRVTCIRFVPRTNQGSYVNFMIGRGCFSQIGRTGWAQDISIGNGCNTRGIVMHEMMHAIGFYHEQSRLDRDNYVNIYWNNISPSNMKFNFQKYSHGQAGYYGEKYDYDSLMHYENRAFGNGRVTISAKNNPNKVLGQRQSFSPIDIRQMNMMYKCQGVVVGTSRPVVTQRPTGNCQDLNQQCSQWRQQNQCRVNPVYMNANCRKSCGLCTVTSGSCTDISQQCGKHATSQNCRSNNYVRQRCQRSCKLCT